MSVALPKLIPTHDNKYVLAEDYTVKNITIPMWYRTNGANIPRVLWSIIPPFKPKYLPAVIAHDYLTDKEEYKRADDVFESMLFDIENSFRTRAMVWAVRKYHYFKYGVKGSK